MKTDPFAVFLFLVMLSVLAFVVYIQRRDTRATVPTTSSSAPSVMPVGLEYTIIPLGTCNGIGVCDEHDSCVGHEPKRPGIYVLVEERVVSGGDGIALACGWKRQ